MNKYRNIVISGNVGSGTSTLSKSLAKKLGWTRFSGGDFFREWSVSNGVPLWDKMSIPDELDKSFDKQVKRKMKEENRLVIDTHYGGWFAKNMVDVFKILLICNKQTAHERISRRTGNQRESETDIEERTKGLRKKFTKLYSNDNYEDLKIFNIVINTSKNSIDDTIKSAYEGFLKT